MKLKYLKILPWILAFLPAIVTILALPWEFHEYEAPLIKKIKGQPDYPYKYYFVDVNHDGYSEKLAIGLNKPSAVPCIQLFDVNDVSTNQYNFRGRWLKNYEPVFADYDGDGIDELFAFSFDNDSIWIFGVKVNEAFEKQKSFEKAVAKVTKINGKEDWIVLPAEAADLNNDGFLEIIFAVSSAFSVHPRAVFAWDIHNDELLRSPYSGFTIGRIMTGDIDADGDEEIYIKAGAPQNIPKTDTIYYHDRVNWLVVLDHELNFLFEPVPYEGYVGHITTVPFVYQGQKGVLAIERCRNSETDKMTLSFYSLSGQKIGQKELNRFIGLFFLRNAGKFKDMPLIFFNWDELKFLKLDANMNFSELSQPTKVRFHGWKSFVVDLGNDSVPEYMLSSANEEFVYIFRDDFRKYITVPMPMASRRSVSLRHRKGLPDQILVNNDYDQYFFEYRHNPYYILKYPIWLLVYLFWVGFFVLLVFFLKKRLQKTYALERKINELQILNMSNQLNPHFILNALTVISGMMFRQDNDNANALLIRFSQLMRSSMLSADKICWSLEKEMNFVEDYLALEHSRFREQFQYTLNYNAAKAKGIDIPRLIIQNHVENALKHGLRFKEEGGMLRVEVNREQDLSVICIEDNGIGREKAKEMGTRGTGMGVKLTEEVFKLYNKLYQRKIYQEITDLYDDKGQASGTRVQIFIGLGKNEPKNG